MTLKRITKDKHQGKKERRRKHYTTTKTSLYETKEKEMENVYYNVY